MSAGGRLLLARTERGIAALVRLAMVLSEITLVAMFTMMAAEMIARDGFNHSFESTDELSGYMLVVIAFLAFGIGLHEGAFFRVEFLYERLRPRAQNAIACVFLLLAILFAAVLDWQLVQLVLSSFGRGNEAPTLLATPLWIPQSVMPVGVTLMIVVLLGLLARQIVALSGGAEERP